MAATTRVQCPLTNSCPTLGTPTTPVQLVCCQSGECQADGGVDGSGAPIPGMNCAATVG